MQDRSCLAVSPTGFLLRQEVPNLSGRLAVGLGDFDCRIAVRHRTGSFWGCWDILHGTTTLRRSRWPGGLRRIRLAPARRRRPPLPSWRRTRTTFRTDQETRSPDTASPSVLHVWGCVALALGESLLRGPFGILHGTVVLGRH